MLEWGPCLCRQESSSRDDPRLQRDDEEGLEMPVVVPRYRASLGDVERAPECWAWGRQHSLSVPGLPGLPLSLRWEAGAGGRLIGIVPSDETRVVLCQAGPQPKLCGAFGAAAAKRNLSPSEQTLSYTQTCISRDKKGHFYISSASCSLCIRDSRALVPSHTSCFSLGPRSWLGLRGCITASGSCGWRWGSCHWNQNQPH